ncbi:esterase/lipase family protein [Vibrio owensii]|uniref:esterase/lipase family protein n=1 Tax=Vibrio owensii TaxID=696485 RepID=UPI0005EFBF42|nr:alpha/beta hydrolase [Vibrio owensii]
MAKIVLRTDSNEIKDIHVIFLHGLGGDANGTWLKKGSKDEAWPIWLAEDNGDLNIWTVEYDAPKLKFDSSGMGIPDLAVNIFEHMLKVSELSEGEIIFVCHSLGGLVTKQILRIANDQANRVEAQQFLGRVSGVAFLGTPHLGADIANHSDNIFVKGLLRCLTFQQPSIAAASLSRNDPNLRELNTWYRDWCQHKEIRHLVLTETEKMYGVVTVVKPDSADPGITGVRAIPISVSHENICKPIDKNDEIYTHIKGFLSQKKREFHELWINSRFYNDTNSWEGYNNWAHCPHGTSGEYFVDEQVRLLDSSSRNSEGLKGLDGLNLIRNKLLERKASIRLVGLSGVGKTRFVQALFDERIGENPLPHKAVFYTDMANSPKPTPQALAEKIAGEGRKSILIIDNCPPDLHRTLTTLCNSETSNTNLLTVEYDLREDQPEQTEVFSLEPSSIDLIEKILNARYQHLGQQNSRTISEFSCGNSRIALALAETIGKDENISSLRDEELFKRLFYQRHANEKSLENTAQYLSLVYSFQINSEKTYSDDITFLSKLSDIPPRDIYESAKELKRRNLVQQRSKWMAVLPHPIANRLAKYALENISEGVIFDNFNELTDERLLKSFSRRLGYLSKCEDAKIIVNDWLSDNGLLHKLYAEGKSELAWVLLTNIAPISTKEVLLHIETLAKQPEFCTRKNKQFTEITRLIRSIAYDEQYFDICAKLLCQFTLSEDKAENYNSIRDILKSLFQLYLSGTHATKEQRLDIIKNLISTATEPSIELAFELLDSSLEAWHFSSSHSFDFGANPRDFGYRPKTNQDVADWYRLFIEYTSEFIINKTPQSERAQKVLAKNLRSLWRQNNLRDLIENTCIKISTLGMWADGFSAIHDILKWDCKTSIETEIQRLQSIAKQLSPKSLLDDINMYVLADKWKFHDLEEYDEDGVVIERGYKKGQQYSIDLGVKVASTNSELLQSMLTELLSYSGSSSNLFEFGEGCAEGTDKNKELLALTVSALEKTPEKERNINFLCGQIKHLSKVNINLTNTFLDEFIKHPELKQYFILVQLSYVIDQDAIARILKALKENTSPVWMYRNLACGRSHEPIADDQLSEMLDLIWKQKDGQAVAIEILSMRFHGLKQNENYVVSDLLKEKSASLLASFDYSEEQGASGGSDYSLTQIANVCFCDGTNEESALTVLKAIKAKILAHIIGRYDFPEFMSTVIQLHPILALEVFIGKSSEIECQIRNAIKGRFDKKVSPFSKIDNKSTLDWCKNNGRDSYPALASIITPYQSNEKTVEWTQLAVELLQACPEPAVVLDKYLSSFSPNGCTGSRAQVLESRLALFQPLIDSTNEDISKWGGAKKAQWEAYIASEYEREAERDSESNERFEW